MAGAVITVPAYFRSELRELTKLAAKFARLPVLSIINEPTAAALAYGLQTQRNKQQLLLVFDMGGGTTDVTLLSVDEKNNFEVIATDGDNHLGGEDFDSEIVRYCSDKFKEQHNSDLFSCPLATHRLRQAVGESKHLLSARGVKTVTVEVANILNDKSLKVLLSRTKFERLCGDLLNRGMEVVKRILEAKNFGSDHIESVIMVGGSSRIYKFEELFRDLFGENKILKRINPDEAVA